MNYDYALCKWQAVVFMTRNVALAKKEKAKAEKASRDGRTIPNGLGEMSEPSHFIAL